MQSDSRHGLHASILASGSPDQLWFDRVWFRWLQDFKRDDVYSPGHNVGQERGHAAASGLVPGHDGGLPIVRVAIRGIQHDVPRPQEGPNDQRPAAICGVRLLWQAPEVPSALLGPSARILASKHGIRLA